MMNGPRTVGMVTATALALSASVAWAGPCRAARTGPGVDGQPDPWRQAVAALIAASADEGQPWGCSGGVILLVAHDTGATLTIVSDDGHATVREVTMPDDVLPLGQALLARPLPPAAPPTAVAPPPDQPSSGALPPPRVLIDALIVPRYAGRSNVILGGVSAGAAIPFGPWFGGVWLRYDALSVSLSPQGGPLTEVCFGAAGGRSFMLGPIELRGSVVPSVAVVTRDTGKPGDGETHVDGRIGLDARGVIPITPLVRAIVALDGEIAPREFGDDMRPRHDDDRFSPFPAYTLGLGVGVELAPR